MTGTSTTLVSARISAFGSREFAAATGRARGIICASPPTPAKSAAYKPAAATAVRNSKDKDRISYSV